MNFPGFLGNDSLKLRLSAALRSGSLSHCYILVGPEGSGKKTLARLMAGAMECTGSGDKPCMNCNACRKIFGGGHPDVITVDSDKATVPISVIRQMQADAYIRPNEGKRKIYLIPRGQDLQAPAQNALLKLLEEPPAYCTFFIMTDNAEKILPTVRSRSVELTLNPLPDRMLEQALREKAPSPEVLTSAMEQSQGYLGQALALLERKDAPDQTNLTNFVTGFLSGDEFGLISALAPLEKLKRNELLELLEQVSATFARGLKASECPGSPVSGLSRELSEKAEKQELFSAITAISQTIALLQNNGNSGLCVGLLLANLRGN